LHLVAESLCHLQFSLQAASPETFGYTLVFHQNVFTSLFALTGFNNVVVSVFSIKVNKGNPLYKVHNVNGGYVYFLYEGEYNIRTN